MGLHINVTYDASAANAPPGFTTAVGAAVAYWESVIATPITVNIVFGWGTVDGAPMDAGALGESFGAHSTFSYAEVAAALAATATSFDDAVAIGALRPDPTGGAGFY